MAGVYKGTEELIGRTPLMEVCRLEKQYGLCARLLVKLEYLNPSGSVKDRAAMYLIRDAQGRGKLDDHPVIIEATSGNTGIALAALAAAKGYHLILTMPETMTVERVNLLKAYGAEVVLTPGEKGMTGAVEKAQELCRQIPDSFMIGQFENAANAKAHYEMTGPEIWEDTEGKVDFFVAGAGTGGTVTGAGAYLKEKCPDIRVITVEPSDSPLLSKGYAGVHGIPGIGADFIPKVLDRTVYDEVMTVETKESLTWAKRLAKTEGILAGISSGAALFAAVKVAQKPECKGKTVVALLPDSGDRYYSTPLFAE